MTDEQLQDVPPEKFWEDFYRAKDAVWSGNANPILVREVTGLASGTALDLGCGEGADAIWLARGGWRVTAVDVSSTALDRAAGHAAAAGVADRIDWQRHDLGLSFPTGTFDLVSAQFLHSPVKIPRDRILRSAASAVAPGGTLLVAGHAGAPSWADDNTPDVRFPTTEEVLAALDLPAGRWQVERQETLERSLMSPDGRPGTGIDNLLRVRRLTGPGA
ncbi:methyltransferase domain-containing protein [Streptomyces scopuliridis]|uniref:Methyltransferase domain-containing protein n=1 Tax=Streptomyces scopuliridis TaxID=452529 RepID=A0ACD4ZW37_9ACTN|nr:class I SAM-dependent methyltransferase [Streptomyces scopuliridis]WSB38176.1 methyltransferase domain-containing protein [Streptomyces scopuliridis]WSC02609.1 methyltransferase domain-containing protein [Streptomyces scopuliridis]WSC03859.1 methyltransferase domain-containing protein [Streptomyces scopuliridis]